MVTIDPSVERTLGIQPEFEKSPTMPSKNIAALLSGTQALSAWSFGLEIGPKPGRIAASEAANWKSRFELRR